MGFFFSPFLDVKFWGDKCLAKISRLIHHYMDSCNLFGHMKETCHGSELGNPSKTIPTSNTTKAIQKTKYLLIKTQLRKTQLIKIDSNW